MWNFHKVADFCWDGLTLKHVSHKGIVFPYFLFWIMGFIFELFLFILVMISAYLFHTFGYRPDFSYFVCIGILIFMFMLTIPILMTIKNKFKPR